MLFRSRRCSARWKEGRARREEDEAGPCRAGGGGGAAPGGRRAAPGSRRRRRGDSGRIFGCMGREVEVVVWWGAMVVGIDPVVAGQIPVGGGGRRQVMVGWGAAAAGSWQHGDAQGRGKEVGGKEARTRGAGSVEEGGGGVGLCSCGRWVAVFDRRVVGFQWAV